MENKVGLKGTFHVAVLSDGKEKYHQIVPNTIMNAGKAVVSGLMLADVGEDAFDHIAIGTDNTAPDATQSALIAEVYRVAGTGSQETTTVTDDTARLTASVSITSSVSIQEAGVFNSDSAGDMLARSTFSAVSVNDGDTINIGYDNKVA
ncbi:MAG: hypothetical protein ACTSQN_16550 [Candidatus Heimdallarchaeota archaeon]